jgi:ribosomal protein S18 acetylase RimI-like enzyme
MTTAVLDNPLWSSLSTLHRAIALASGDILRYPAEVAPFLAVPDPRALTGDALDALVAPDETVLMLGAEPHVPAGWQLESLGSIVQMICAEPLPVLAGPPVTQLTEADRPAVLALTALVYPHYFRPRTMDLGRYIGVVEEQRLDAMLGERMGFPGYREISAVCTHPDHVGRGLARHLLVHASNRLFAEGPTPFLHVSPKNERAIRLYEQNHFKTRIAIAFWSLRRA